MTTPNDSMITIAQAVVNKYGKDEETRPGVIESLGFALECHQQAVLNNLPTFTILLYFSEVYNQANKVLQDWRDGGFDEGCTLLPMLDNAISLVNVPNLEVASCPTHGNPLPCLTS